MAWIRGAARLAKLIENLIFPCETRDLAESSWSSLAHGLVHSNHGR